MTEDLAESNKPSANSLKMAVSPKKINLNSAITKAITKKEIQMIFNAILSIVYGTNIAHFAIRFVFLQP
jgi:hypothetical protein